MTQPRKRPEFICCPVCSTEFRRRIDYRGIEQRWCTRDCAQAARRHARAAVALQGPVTRTAGIPKQANDAAAGTMWRELVRRPMRKERS
jgi:hypothetical protein